VARAAAAYRACLPSASSSFHHAPAASGLPCFSFGVAALAAWRGGGKHGFGTFAPDVVAWF